MFTAKNKLPAELASKLDADFLKKGDARRAATELADGSWLLLASAGPVVVSEDATDFLGRWYEIQHVLWESDRQVLLVRWVDPKREPWGAKTVDDDPRPFMASFEEFVEYAIVSSARRQADNGTWITASIRRREDGELFSTLVADGPLDVQGEQLANDLESRIRETVGLE